MKDLKQMINLKKGQQRTLSEAQIKGLSPGIHMVGRQDDPCQLPCDLHMHTMTCTHGHTIDKIFYPGNLLRKFPYQKVTKEIVICLTLLTISLMCTPYMYIIIIIPIIKSINKKMQTIQWHMPLISALRRQKQVYLC